MLPSRAVKHQAGRFNRRSAQDHDLAESFVRLLCCLIDERNAFGLSGFRIDDDMTRDRIGSERHSPSLCRRGQSRAGAAEVRKSRATTIAVAAVVTRGAAVVSLSQYRGAPNRHSAIFPTALDSLLQEPFAARHLHRRQEFS